MLRSFKEKERMPDLTSASRPYLPTIHYSAGLGTVEFFFAGTPKPSEHHTCIVVILGLFGLFRRTVASCVPLAIPPDQKYNSLGALCDSLLIAPSLLHRESGAVSRPIHSLRNPYWFSGSLSLRYRHQSINIQPPLWWELAVALNPILRS